MLSADDQRSLIWLQCHWDRWYVITVTGNGTRQAIRITDPRVTLTAPAAWELQDLLKDDYAAAAAAWPPGTGCAGGSL